MAQFSSYNPISGRFERDLVSKNGNPEPKNEENLSTIMSAHARLTPLLELCKPLSDHEYHSQRPIEVVDFENRDDPASGIESDDDGYSSKSSWGGIKDDTDDLVASATGEDAIREDTIHEDATREPNHLNESRPDIDEIIEEDGKVELAVNATTPRRPRKRVLRSILTSLNLPWASLATQPSIGLSMRQ